MSREAPDRSWAVAAALVTVAVPELGEEDRAALVEETAALLAELGRLGAIDLGDGPMATAFAPDE